jgi:hypothetical protein
LTGSVDLKKAIFGGQRQAGKHTGRDAAHLRPDAPLIAMK